MLPELIDFVLHLDRHLDAALTQYGTLTYALLFGIVFLETGVVVTPFLPGDSLLFAAGALAARGSLDPVLLLVLLTAAAILGDTVNYWIGALVGPRVFRAERARLFRRDHLERAHRFYETYGGITVVLARFLPIFRTFVPFVAGIGRMTYHRFLTYNVAGGILWVSLFVVGGYYFGNLQVVRDNFTLVILAIILISLLPASLETLRHVRRARQAPTIRPTASSAGPGRRADHPPGG
ncbi:MAG: DedA family protein [Armatimonadota bacterium]|nr:DedA family protein [Armatimonadota bacterium]MDR7451172.1 DedA family protein [Armatimonadota bacterium]MDR7467223.1 DedA family protein [Armatimonadota bacterium]MDR7494849.1 DedA family protein [Armatimonadota bacterium]MDR7500258.1 DedA family protein [Armatimonadota bacterium]